MSLHAVSLVLSWATILISLTTVSLMVVTRRRIYHSGWIDGRIDLLLHMKRAQEEGLPFPMFIRQVAARDGYPLPGDLPQQEGQ